MSITLTAAIQWLRADRPLRIEGVLTLPAYILRVEQLATVLGRHPQKGTVLGSRIESSRIAAQCRTEVSSDSKQRYQEAAIILVSMQSSSIHSSSGWPAGRSYRTSWASKAGNDPSSLALLSHTK
ncbi:hypothetical protein BD310DRAFT_576718 [Dichomitus squalens]|uniref:Uncharacterized protein n=1 Tax=Dichomitus squalens TaxID=114155 RepID=A0A4V2K9C9_9APHY|nr:hypothetical protein BD310DRAFT_576718 [Dichomitus squalens]